jgi:hypothetical protein
VTQGAAEDGTGAQGARRVFSGQEPGIHAYDVSDERAGDLRLMRAGTGRIFVAAADERNLAAASAELVAGPS